MTQLSRTQPAWGRTTIWSWDYYSPG